MFSWLKSVFSKPEKVPEISESDGLWNAMESMDARISLTRLRQLNLSPQQFPMVRGLLEGSLSPSDRPGISEWCREQEVSTTGTDALTFALQMALGSEGSTCVFQKSKPYPVAILPKFVSRDNLTVIMTPMGNNPFTITSLNEFVSSESITDYSTEVLTPSALKRRVTKEPSFARDRIDRGATPSVTLERQVDNEDRLLEPFDISALAEAVGEALDCQLTADKLTIVEGKIETTGLFTCIAQVDSITEKKVRFWVVPKVGT